MIYEIAGLKVEMNPQFERLKKQSEDYRSFGEPVMLVKPHPHDEMCVAGTSEEEREYILYSAAFCRDILPFGRFFLHASAVVYKGEGYLFSAPSGIGKSTHTALWRQLFPESYILNDDKPIILPQDKQIFVWGTPFSGKSGLHKNRKVPLKAICFLRQDITNSIRKITQERAMALILNNTWQPKNREKMNLLLDMAEQVVANTDIYEMGSVGDLQAARLSYDVMKGK